MYADISFIEAFQGFKVGDRIGLAALLRDDKPVTPLAGIRRSYTWWSTKREVRA